GTIRVAVPLAELPHERSDARIMDVADSGKQVVLDLVPHTVAGEPTNQPGTEVDRALRLPHHRVVLAPFDLSELCIRRKVGRSEREEHEVPHRRDPEEVQEQTFSDRQEQTWHHNEDAYVGEKGDEIEPVGGSAPLRVQQLLHEIDPAHALNVEAIQGECEGEDPALDAPVVETHHAACRADIRLVHGEEWHEIAV